MNLSHRQRGSKGGDGRFRQRRAVVVSRLGVESGDARSRVFILLRRSRSKVRKLPFRFRRYRYPWWRMWRACARFCPSRTAGIRSRLCGRPRRASRTASRNPRTRIQTAASSLTSTACGAQERPPPSITKERRGSFRSSECDRRPDPGASLEVDASGTDAQIIRTLLELAMVKFFPFDEGQAEGTSER